MDLLPRETVDLAEVQLYASINHAGAGLAADWTARSQEASGVLPGIIEIPVDAHAPTIEELLAEPEGPPGDEDEGADRDARFPFATVQL